MKNLDLADEKEAREKSQKKPKNKPKKTSSCFLTVQKRERRMSSEPYDYAARVWARKHDDPWNGSVFKNNVVCDPFRNMTSIPVFILCLLL